MATYPHNRVAKRLFEILADAEIDSDTIWGNVREFALEEMEPLQRTVYQYIEKANSEYWGTQQARLFERMLAPKERRHEWVFAPPRFTSVAIAAVFGIQRKHSSTIMKELFDMYLLKRELIESDAIREYEYWI